MKAIIISGPTASKKSDLALKLAQIEEIVIINADALQIYKDLPILSSQPTFEDFQKVQHKLYSHLNFDEEISVAIWLNLVKKEIEEAFENNKIPVIVGGGGMYISKLVNGISFVPEIENEVKNYARNLFLELEKEKFIENLVVLGENYDEIKNLDKQRLIRLFEVLKQTGKNLKYWQNNSKNFVIDPKIFIHINLEIEREKLYQNCDLRFLKMFENGAIYEVEALLQKNIEDEMQICKTLGFFEIRDFLENKITKNQAIEIASRKTRNYAKRQITWFKHQFQEKNVFYNQESAIEFLKKIL